MHARLEIPQYAFATGCLTKRLMRLGLRRAVIFPVLLRPQMRQRLADGWNALLLVALRDLWVGCLPQGSEIYAAGTVWRNWLSSVVGRWLMPSDTRLRCLSMRVLIMMLILRLVLVLWVLLRVLLLLLLLRMRLLLLLHHEA